MNSQESPPVSDHESASSGSPFVWMGSGLAVLILTGALFSAAAAEQLLLGWLYFPVQVLPQISLYWPSIVLGATCCVAFVVGLHATLKWFVVLRPSPSEEKRTWTIRSTLVVAAATALLFAAGTTMVAASHQTIWLISGYFKPASAEQVEAPHGLLASARRAANQSSRKNNLKQFGLAMHNFHEAGGKLPAGGTMTADGTLLHGWAVRLGPFLTFQTGNFDFSVPWNQPPNARLYRSALPVFLNPEIPQVFNERGFALSHLAANSRVFPIVTVDESSGKTLPESRTQPLRIKDMTDGTSNTILLGEVRENFKPWGHPVNVRDPAIGISRSPDGFGAPGQGAFMLLGDGTVRLIGENTDLEVLRRLATPNDGEPVGGF